MKNLKLLIILTIIFFIPFCLISGIKGFICGIIGQAEESLQDIKHAIKQKNELKQNKTVRAQEAARLTKRINAKQ